MPKILVVDDNHDILEALDLLLSLHGYKVILASSKKEALLTLTRQHVDLVIQDMNFSYSATTGQEGLELFYELKQLNPQLPIVLITAWSHLEKAVELVKAGAADYLQKPWDDTKLLETIAKYVNATQGAAKQPRDNQQTFIFKSPLMLDLIYKAEKIAQSEINVLITGANGSGKEKLADHIHLNSERKQSPFVKVNMGALPHELMEAELFGAEKGAFTGANDQRVGRFEAANGGTLFLDEIGNLTLSGQMKLLRVLQTGEFERVGSSVTQKVDVRVISATNADLAVAVQKGEFREDLYYRLNVVELHIPSLNKRQEDIVPLAEFFVGEEFQLSPKVKSYLCSQPWPGNVRELENACKRACVFTTGNVIEIDAFIDSKNTLVMSEKEKIENVITKHNGVIKRAADELGITRQALYRRIEKYQIKV